MSILAGITDAAILAAIDRGDGCGGRSYNVCQRLDLNSTAAFRAMTVRLTALERRGVVKRCPRYSAVNSIFWRTHGRLHFPLEQLTEPTRAILGNRPVFIWSGEHGAFWRPEGCGYTTHHEEAGQWPANDAYRKVSHCCPAKKISLVAVRP